MRYVIYDNKSEVITPSGKTYTAEEWLNKYPWAKKTKMVVSGGTINGSIAYVFDEFVEMFVRAGLDFSDCETDEDKLALIEEFEDSTTGVAPEETVQERIANALEDLVALNLPDVE